MMENNSDLMNIIKSYADQKILVIGEAMLDCYLQGTTDRLCREAPVPVVAINKNICIPGGAANTAVNLASLNAQAVFLSVIGQDPEGTRLLQSLAESRVSTGNIIRVSGRRTLSKQRVLADSQMIVRFDQGSTFPLDRVTEKKIIGRLEILFRECNALIISDYSYGIITPKLIEALEEFQANDPRLIIVDSARPQEYRNLDITAVKPNYEETVRLLGLKKIQDDDGRIKQIERQGKRILDLAGARIAAITLDRKGALIFSKDDETPYRTYAKPHPDSRAAGAGDTFVSALAVSLAAGAEVGQAAELASAAASIVVAKSGTAICFGDELANYFSSNEKFIGDTFQLNLRVAYYRRSGRKIVFTNGCFDILHRGHIACLNSAKTLGDILIVGLNSDESVARLKGPNRPVNSFEDRIQVLSALQCIDHIVSFSEDSPAGLLRTIQPEVFVKGGDYTPDTLPEAGLVKALGGRVEILPYLEDHSTSGMIERIHQLAGDQFGKVPGLLSDIGIKKQHGL